MPMKRLLDESRAFDPKAIAILVKAFDGVVAELNLQTMTERERAPKSSSGLRSVSRSSTVQSSETSLSPGCES